MSARSLPKELSNVAWPNLYGYLDPDIIQLIKDRAIMLDETLVGFIHSDHGVVSMVGGLSEVNRILRYCTTQEHWDGALERLLAHLLE